jgi:mono/diheme cytochrome c family protein
MTPLIATRKPTYAANCASCHGATGEGGPSLKQIAQRKSLAQIIAFFESPSGAAMPKLYPATLSAAQVRDVATHISETFR